MKILLIFTLCLISGPVSCFDVIGYSGGSVIIHCRDKQYGVINKYFCKETPTQTPKQCVFVRFQNKWSHKDRFSLRDSSEVFTVIYRNLSLQDAGSYQCGETGVWSHDVNLEVKTAKETSPSPKQPSPGGPSSTSTTTSAPTGTTSDKHFAPGSSVIIIPVCVCVALLLIGGSALIYYKLRCTKTQGSISSSNVAKMGSNNRIPPHSACDYEEIRDPRPYADTGATPLSVELPSDPPNAVTVTEQQLSNSPVQHIYSEVDLPTEAHTYATVSIQNEDSHTDATVAFHTGNCATMYATVKPPTAGMTINKP
ncbi:hypothetical protein SRHO_G00177770 [Serrasalmus rhombeus]